jgi:hypothetical protein
VFLINLEGNDMSEDYGLGDIAKCNKCKKISIPISEYEAMKATSEEDTAVIDMLSKRLAEVAIALKGEELPLQRHSYHDLGELVAAMRLDAERWRIARENGIAQWNEFEEITAYLYNYKADEYIDAAIKEGN